MRNDLDWVSRDLQRLAAESKLTRAPTPEEWARIWSAATDWADAVGVTTSLPPIDDWIRQHAPGLLRDAAPRSDTPAS